MNQCQEPHALTLTEDKCKAKLQQAKDNFDFQCSHSETLRREYVKQLAKALAKKNNSTEESELKKLTNISHQKKRAARFRKARCKGGKGLATKLAERKPDGSREIVEDQDNLV